MPCLPCGQTASDPQRGLTSQELDALAASAKPERYEVTRGDGTTETYTSLVDALRERNRTGGTYRQLR